MDHLRCLEVQRPYLGTVEAHCIDWAPISGRWTRFDEEIDPWQCKNVLAS